ncbi:molybdopterin-dependent oxidoreductase [Litoribacillus peritrichatus]|uniref:Nitrate reductase n=1 Tax=Litoribacillus peritrichatus TaxID=718191 RepID=A0ABP7N6W0_9GAMM
MQNEQNLIAKEESNTQTIKTTCAYCGVGCGIEAEVDVENRVVSVKGDPEHPSNYGRLCSKGSALGETLGLSSRLLQPQVYGRPASWDDALSLVAEKFQAVIDEYGPEAVAFYGSGQLLTEDYYVANKLMKGFIGGSNIDTNSRLCMSSSVAGHKRAFGTDTVPACYDDFTEADLIVLVGSNTAWCHPVSFQRIRAAKEANPNLKVVVVDPRKTNTCDIADLHIPVKIGSDVALFNGLLSYLYQEDALDQAYIQAHTEGFEDAIQAAQTDAFNVYTVAEKCDLAPHVVETFFRWFKETDKTLTLYSQGVNQSSSGTDKVNSILNCHLATGRMGKPGTGPLSLTGQPNAMGGREVGGLANTLAAHMEFNPDDLDRVARFWNTESLTQAPGLPAVDLFDAVADGKIKAIWVMATNPVASMPNADKVRGAIENCDFVVVSDCVAHADTLDLAHVKLPAAGWSEKDGTVTNSERRISRQRALLPLAGDSKPDWWIITQLAHRMGFKDSFPYETNADIFREHAQLSGFENSENERLRDFNISKFSDISQAEYDALMPVQWPVTQDTPNGVDRFFANGGFYTPNRKAKLVAVESRKPENLPNKDWPLVLNSGRVRDQWHSMTRTALASRLNQHKPEPFVEITPADAEKYRLQNGHLAIIKSQWGEMLARVEVTDRLPQGDLFVPMHWTSQFSNHGRMGVVVNPVVDPISFQPESKHTPVSIAPFEAAWHGFIISRHPLILDGIDYVVLVKGEGYFRYELAGSRSIRSWQSHLSSQLVPHSGELEWQTYHDPAKSLFRTACFHDDELQAVLVTGPDYALPDRNWIGSLFDSAKEEGLKIDERMALLTGKPPLGTPDVGKIICACFNVGEKTIEKAIQEGNLKTHQEVGQCCKAGTNCGSCVPEIKGILAAVGK